MPSGGFIAMGNLRHIARDLRAGLLALTAAQYRFLRGARGTYDAVVAIGDVVRAADVAFGRLAGGLRRHREERQRRALRTVRGTRPPPRAAVFVRDEPTARRCATPASTSKPAANVIVDLFGEPGDRARRGVRGLRSGAAAPAGQPRERVRRRTVFAGIVRELARARPVLGACSRSHRLLDAARFEPGRARTGGACAAARSERALRLARRALATSRARGAGRSARCSAVATLAMGQAGTANEAAGRRGRAGRAFERGRDRKTGWYRKRQCGLARRGARDFSPRRTETRSACATPPGRSGAHARGWAVGRQRMGAPGARAAHRRARAACCGRRVTRRCAGRSPASIGLPLAAFPSIRRSSRSNRSSFPASRSCRGRRHRLSPRGVLRVAMLAPLAAAKPARNPAAGAAALAVRGRACSPTCGIRPGREPALCRDLRDVRSSWHSALVTYYDEPRRRAHDLLVLYALRRRGCGGAVAMVALRWPGGAIRDPARPGDRNVRAAGRTRGIPHRVDSGRVRARARRAAERCCDLSWAVLAVAAPRSR